MGSILSRAKVGLEQGGRPPAAIEISPAGVLAAAKPSARTRRDAVATGEALVYAFVPLPAGALVPGIEEPNLRGSEAVSEAIRSALDQVAPRKRAVTVVLPDTLVRIFVLDFDSLPAKSAEALSVVRFRLRKMVPFEAENAGVSFQMLSQTETECKVLVAVMPGPILEEYEGAVRAAGYEPGAVLPSSLAALETLDSMEAAFAVNLGARSITTSIANGQDLLLYRTLDLPEDPGQRTAEVQRSIAVAAAYFEDKLGSRPRRLFYSGVENLAEFAASIGEPELSVVDWVSRPEEGAMTALPQASFAGVAGALVGAS
ncbi:MAG: type IV pilus biogenesis protein PilM [Terracidiphilus sp.]